MNILTPEIKNYYSCQFCGLIFISIKEETIEKNIYPVCCSRCNFMIVYTTIKNIGFNDEILEFMQKRIEKKEKIIDFKRQQAIFIITKFYLRKGLASINIIGTLDKDKVETDKKSDNGTMGQEFPPYRIGGIVPVPVPSFSNQSNLVSCPIKDSKGGLKKWF